MQPSDDSSGKNLPPWPVVNAGDLVPAQAQEIPKKIFVRIDVVLALVG